MYSEGELEWQECLKREAEFLTLSAENQRMKEELSLVESSLAERGAEMQRMQAEL